MAPQEGQKSYLPRANLLAGQNIKIEITLSHEADQEISRISLDDFVNNSEALFCRGLYAHYARRNYLKAKQYYKNAIMVGAMAAEAVQSWANKMIATHEPLLHVLRYIKKHKYVWNGRIEEYRHLKKNVRTIYEAPISVPHRAGQGAVCNLVEISVHSSKSFYPYKWEDDQLFMRRAMFYDPAVARILPLYIDRNQYPNSRMPRQYLANPGRNRIKVYVVELMHDANTSEVMMRADQVAFEFQLLSTGQVWIDRDSYYEYVEKVEPRTTILREDLHWTNRMMESVSQRIMKGVDFATFDDAEELEADPMLQSEKEDEREKKAEQTLKIWEDFHFGFALDSGAVPEKSQVAAQ